MSITKNEEHLIWWDSLPFDSSNTTISKRHFYDNYKASCYTEALDYTQLKSHEINIIYKAEKTTETSIAQMWWDSLSQKDKNFFIEEYNGLTSDIEVIYEGENPLRLNSVKSAIIDNIWNLDINKNDSDYIKAKEMLGVPDEHIDCEDSSKIDFGARCIKWHRSNTKLAYTQKDMKEVYETGVSDGEKNKDKNIKDLVNMLDSLRDTFCSAVSPKDRTSSQHRAIKDCSSLIDKFKNSNSIL
jgi:hypothetical protein